VKIDTADPLSSVFSKSANLLDLPQKSTIHAFFKTKSVDPKILFTSSLLVAGKMQAKLLLKQSLLQY